MASRETVDNGARVAFVSWLVARILCRRRRAQTRNSVRRVAAFVTTEERRSSRDACQCNGYLWLIDGETNEMNDKNRIRNSKIAAVAVGVLLFLALVACLPLVAHAQDGNAQRNDQTTNQGQDVSITVVCAENAVCNQDVTVGGQEPPTAIQENALPAASPPSSPCPAGLEFDAFFGECYDPRVEMSWGDVWTIFASAVVIGVGIILMWATRPKDW